MSMTNYDHFHVEEHPFIDRMMDKLVNAEQHHRELWTDFLDPRQQLIVNSLVKRTPELQVVFFGGHPNAERKRAWIAPVYFSFDPADGAVALMKISSLDNRLDQLRHSDYLGSLLGLGIKREKLGDIYVAPDDCQFLLAVEMVDYVRLHLNQVHRVRVSIERLPFEQLEYRAEPLEEFEVSVASLRLDGIVSDVCRMSRAKALVPIKAGKCRINWRIEESPSAILAEGDLVSLKGWGRFKVLEIRGLTKKGNMRVKIGKFV
jgi:RNA-binding protein YlmH